MFCYEQASDVVIQVPMLQYVRGSENNQGKSHFSVLTNWVFSSVPYFQLDKCLMMAAFNYVFKFRRLCLS